MGFADRRQWGCAAVVVAVFLSAAAGEALAEVAVGGEEFDRAGAPSRVLKKHHHHHQHRKHDDDEEKAELVLAQIDSELASLDSKSDVEELSAALQGEEAFVADDLQRGEVIADGSDLPSSPAEEEAKEAFGSGGGDERTVQLMKAQIARVVALKKAFAEASQDPHVQEQTTSTQQFLISAISDVLDRKFASVPSTTGEGDSAAMGNGLAAEQVEHLVGQVDNDSVAAETADSGNDEAQPEAQAAVYADEAQPEAQAAVYADEAQPEAQAAVYADEAQPEAQAAVYADEAQPEAQAAVYADEAQPDMSLMGGGIDFDALNLGGMNLGGISPDLTGVDFQKLMELAFQADSPAGVGALGVPEDITMEFVINAIKGVPGTNTALPGDVNATHLSDTGRDTPPPLQLLDICQWRKLEDIPLIPADPDAVDLHVDSSRNRILLTFRPAGSANTNVHVSYDMGATWDAMPDMNGRQVPKVVVEGDRLLYIRSLVLGSPTRAYKREGADWRTAVEETIVIRASSTMTDICASGDFIAVAGFTDLLGLTTGGYSLYTTNNADWFQISATGARKCAISPDGLNAAIMAGVNLNIDLSALDEAIEELIGFPIDLQNLVAPAGIFRSLDSGGNWESLSFYVGGGEISHLFATNEATYATHPTLGIYRTTNNFFRTWRDGWDNNGLPVGAPTAFGQITGADHSVFIASPTPAFGILASLNTGLDWGQLNLPPGLGDLTATDFFTQGVHYEEETGTLYAMWNIGGNWELHAGQCDISTTTSTSTVSP